MQRKYEARNHMRTVTSQNGDVGSFKPSDHHRNIKNKQKLPEPPLSELWKTVKSLQQPSKC